ncbi:unnamed protein product, partial [Rotaria sp. Silwood2]
MFPVSVTSTFAILTYRRLRSLNTQERRSLSALTKQMARMALFQILIVLLFMTPYGIATAYFISSATIVKNAYRTSQEQMAQLFFLLYGYGTYA